MREKGAEVVIAKRTRSSELALAKDKRIIHTFLIYKEVDNVFLSIRQLSYPLAVYLGFNAQ